MRQATVWMKANDENMDICSFWPALPRKSCCTQCLSLLNSCFLYGLRADALNLSGRIWLHISLKNIGTCVCSSCQIASCRIAFICRALLTGQKGTLVLTGAFPTSAYVTYIYPPCSGPPVTWGTTACALLLYAVFRPYWAQEHTYIDKTYISSIATLRPVVSHVSQP